MFVSFLSPHLSLTWIWRTLLSLECITHYLFISSPAKTHSHLSQNSSRFCDLVSLPFPVSDVVAFTIVKALPLTCATVNFQPLTLCIFYSWSSSCLVSSWTYSGYSFHKFVTETFSIIRGDGLSSFHDHILDLPLKLRSCRLQFRFQFCNFTPPSVFTLFTFLPTSTGPTMFLFLPEFRTF